MMKSFPIFVLFIFGVALMPAGGSLFSLAWAQEFEIPADLDITAPVIQHDPLTEPAPVGKPLLIEAIVTDNISITAVTLYYRSVGQTQYSGMNMMFVGNNTFRATLSKEVVSGSGIEYYIQAQDVSGNITLRGFTASPLLVTLAPASSVPVISPSEQTASLTPEKSAITPWYKKKKVWWVVAGIAVIGGVVAASEDGDTEGVPSSSGSVTLVVPSPIK